MNIYANFKLYAFLMAALYFICAAVLIANGIMAGGAWNIFLGAICAGFGVYDWTPKK